VADDRSTPDPADVERRKKELLAAARGEKSDDRPNSMAGLGLQFVVTVLVCLFIGQWLDRKLGTTPWLLLAGMMLGAGIGLWTMLRVMRAQEAEDARRHAERDGGRRNGGEGT
jgi:F0F1-type ATP synthase assembly protein I